MTIGPGVPVTARREVGLPGMRFVCRRNSEYRKLVANMAWRLLILTVLILNRWSYEAQGQESKYLWLEIAKLIDCTILEPDSKSYHTEDISPMGVPAEPKAGYCKLTLARAIYDISYHNSSTVEN